MPEYIEKAAVLEAIKNMENSSQTERAFELLRVADTLLRRQADNFYVLNLLEEEVYYDGAVCDGRCLMEDIEYLLEEVGRLKEGLYYA